MTEAHTQRAHAKLSPSGAYRWLACPGSVRLCKGIPDKSSSFAAEGTAAHTLAEICMREGSNTDTFIGFVIDTRTGAYFEGEADGESVFEVTDEMAEGVQIYLDYIRGISDGNDADDVLEIESKLDLTHVYPNTFGTVDALFYDASEAHLYVCDLKYGRGVAVEPEENEQLLTYAVGALRRYHNRPLAKVTLAVIQPRAAHRGGPVRIWETDPVTVMEFEETLRQGALETEKYDAPLVAGDHCKFCKAAAICPALRAKAFEIAKAEFADDTLVLPEVMKMDKEELGLVLKQADLLKDWCRRVEAFAHEEALSGNVPQGFKLVAKRAIRKWRDEKEAAAMLSYAFDLSDDYIYTEPQLKTPAQIEKVLGKKNSGALEGLVVENSSGFVLAEEGDPRSAVKVEASTEFAD